MSHQPYRDSLHEPLKPRKYIPFQTLKATDIFTNFLKSFLGICLVASISLFSFLAFSKWFNCSEYQHIFISTTTSDFSTNDITVYHDETNISHILVRIGGSSMTWNDREVWWNPKVMRGFVWLDQRPPENDTWPETSPTFQVSQDTSKVRVHSPYGSKAAVRIARIVKESFELGMENARWFLMGDDDTVFFPKNLVTVLSKYDHKQMYYIGSNSESVEQDEIHSYTMAYGGGGGFAVSYALAAELVRVLDGCIDRYTVFYGSDEKIGGCMNEIGVPPPKELGSHQMDIREDPYGLLAAHPMAPLVSLHHVDYVQPPFPDADGVESVKKLVGAYRLIDDENKCENEEYAPALLIRSVIVSAQEVWKKAPRRQCCEVVNEGDVVDGILHVNIRGCNQWETVTPP